MTLGSLTMENGVLLFFVEVVYATPEEGELLAKIMCLLEKQKWKYPLRVKPLHAGERSGKDIMIYFALWLYKETERQFLRYRPKCPQWNGPLEAQRQLEGWYRCKIPLLKA